MANINVSLSMSASTEELLTSNPITDPATEVWFRSCRLGHKLARHLWETQQTARLGDFTPNTCQGDFQAARKNITTAHQQEVMKFTNVSFPQVPQVCVTQNAEPESEQPSTVSETVASDPTELKPTKTTIEQCKDTVDCQNMVFTAAIPKATPNQ